MFASHEVALDLAFPVARMRLGGLARSGRLGSSSERAYADGLSVIRVGPFGSVLGASKLVRVRLLEPLPREGEMVVPLRWEATGAMGRLFPVLDANLVLTAGQQGGCCTLAMVGAYRPPLGATGAALDRVMLHRAALATVRALVTDVADTLLAPDTAAARAPRAAAEPLPRPAAWRAEPEMPC